jgi:hypothetical protein
LRDFRRRQNARPKAAAPAIAAYVEGSGIAETEKLSANIDPLVMAGIALLLPKTSKKNPEVAVPAVQFEVGLAAAIEVKEAPLSKL